MLKTDDLLYFVTVAQTASVNQTAEKLHITPSAISHSLKKLETTLGHSLFTRSSKGMELTSEGHVLLPLAIQALDAMKEIETTAQQLTQEKATTALPSFSSCVLFGEQGTFADVIPPFSNLFYQQIPNVELIFSERPLQTVVQNIAQDMFSFALIMLGSDLRAEILAHHPNIAIRTIATHQIALLAKRHSRLLPPLDETGSITLEQAIQLPLILSDWNSSSDYTYKNLLRPFQSSLNALSFAPNGNISPSLVANDKGVILGITLPHYPHKWQVIPLRLKNDVTIDHVLIYNQALDPALAETFYQIACKIYESLL